MPAGFKQVALHVLVAAFVGTRSLLPRVTIISDVYTLATNGLFPPSLRRDIITVLTSQATNTSNDALVSTTEIASDDDIHLSSAFIRMSFFCSIRPSECQDRIETTTNIDWIRKAATALESVKLSHPHVSYLDLYTYAGLVALMHEGGPYIPYSFGKRGTTIESTGGTGNTPKNDPFEEVDILSDPKKALSKVKDLYMTKLGFDVKDSVLLVFAYTLKRCGETGNDGSNNKNHLLGKNNAFQILLQAEAWTKIKGKKGKQSRQFFENVVGENTYVMLPTCLALMKDPEMTSAINAYANSQNLLSKDLASAYNKLLSLSLA